MKYVSRGYLKEKWEDLKWDMEHIILDYSRGGGDQVPEEDVKAVIYNISDKMNSIIKELVSLRMN